MQAELTERVDLGGAGGSGPELLRPVGATVLDDGTIMVADAWAYAVHTYDPAGGWVRSVGREGNGPGEFRTIRWIGNCKSEAAYVWDSRDRITEIDGTTGMRERFRVDGELDGRIGALACNESGGMAFVGPLNRASFRSEELTADLYYRDPSGGTRVIRRDVFAAMNVDPLGAVVSVAMGEHSIFTTIGDSMIVRQRDFSGRVLKDIAVTVARRRAEERHRRARVAELAMVFPGREQRARAESTMLAMSMSEHVPWYSAINVVEGHWLWVTTSVAGDVNTEFIIIDVRHGLRQAAISLNRAMRVFDVGRRYLVGAYEDRAGHPHVVVYDVSFTER